MKLSTKGRYAVMALLDMADNYVDNPVTLQAIAQRQQLSLSYLEQLFLQLRRAGLVVSVRGAGGGYRFMVQPEDLTIYQIMQATQESFKSTQCDRHSHLSCLQSKSTKCRTHDLWIGLEDVIENYLSGITLGQLMAVPIRIQSVISTAPERRVYQ